MAVSSDEHCCMRCPRLWSSWSSRLVRKPWAAMLGAVLFALHPLQVESVAWVTSTSNLLSSAAFALGRMAFFAIR